MSYKGSILIVEGDEKLRELFFKELNKEGYFIRIVYNSRGCLRELGEREWVRGVKVKHKFDLICLDAGIEYDGDIMGFCKGIKIKGTTLLLMANKLYLDLARELLDMGVIDGYINKNLENIKATIKNYFCYVHSDSQ